MGINRFCCESWRNFVKVVVTDCQKLLGVWLATRTDGEYVSGKMKYIGLWDGEQIVAVSGFEAFNGVSIMMHCAGDGKRWLNKEFLWFSFYYPFVQLGAKVIISPVESTNLACRRFIEHIGFNIEATLKDCSPGGDLLLYRMGREKCRWLDLKRIDSSGKTQST
jgi:hypothetical protein